ncbi:photosynthetic reaction center subunit H [uncultured Alsobacter sp.]|uniref:photosynthetic reaction center subunit H n=1 Tax=uncultured Alsobacter sp. TaxID=1748258 RepID=UPI0025EA9296|nr:photosynthetic reaction center subunit H [uncultured Alsobacter sp.]
MLRGALTQNIDVAQVVLYAFWVFFAGLIFYIRQEDRREGYPLENDKTGKVGIWGWPFIPDAKTFLLAHGQGSVSVPNDKRDTRPIKAKKIAPFAGAPLEPTGNPLADGVGPASWAERADRADLNLHGNPRIVPISSLEGWVVDPHDPDPRGYRVMGCDRKSAGTISDIWVDTSEHTVRYLEVSVTNGPKVLLPITFTLVNGDRGHVYVHALKSTHFAGVPQTKNPAQVTLQEEDKITGYYGGGMLYATRERAEPIL